MQKVIKKFKFYAKMSTECTCTREISLELHYRKTLIKECDNFMNPNQDVYVYYISFPIR